MPITALYAGLLTPLLVFLILRVIGARGAAKVALGDGGDPALLRRIRVHANFIETVPMALVLIGLAESLATPAWMLHVLGAALVVGRLVHAFGVSQPRETLVFRVIGTATTLGVLGLAAAACLIGTLGRGVGL